MSWPVGTIVVCVDAGPILNTYRSGRVERTGIPSGLIYGAYYTVASEAPPAVDGHRRIFLAEPPHSTPCGEGLGVFRFRLAESQHSESTSAATRHPTKATT